ncbi:craniofacial development protein 2-like [Palaemon carinicauda]|uniref:craniofacial development protein 2-like n=1 Tax=Palaemon carinicauda TaxID=392227 RepID=UPI0035B5D362
MSIIGCYAPSNDSREERKDEYYEELQSVVDENPDRDIKIEIGDFNTKVGRNNQGVENLMGVDGLGEVGNEYGSYFISFCLASNLVNGGILFQQKDIHKYTSTSQYGNYKNQLDHIAINKKSRTLGIVRSYGGAHIGSDHQLVTATLKLKLKDLTKM